MADQIGQFFDGSYESEPLVFVSVPQLFISMAPLAVVAFLSETMELELVSPIVVGCIRTFAQLSILGFILQPIFVRGIEWWWLVLLYVCFMTVLAAREASQKTNYYFQSQFLCVLGSLAINVIIVSLFGFCIIIRPDPLWNPQYVIPIVGMLLHNCLNAIALSLNTLLSSLVERQSEVELYLGFGASGREASSRLVREAVRTGATPMLNSMAVIGLISIPGMMTGNILGGTPAMQAARYQMLIIYLIAICCFGTILTEIWIARRVAFDSKGMLRTERFIKRAKRKTCLMLLTEICCFGRDADSSERNGESSALLPVTGNETNSYVAPKGKFQILSMTSGDTSKPTQLEIQRLMRSVPSMEGGSKRRVLFRDIHADVAPGGISLVSGPSGVGKSQFLRAVAGLSPIDEGEITLNGHYLSTCPDMSHWRQQVRYVTQQKVDIPGTPRDFIREVASFRSFQYEDAPTFESIVASSLDIVQRWGLDSHCLDKDWSMLSGGEAQRMIVATAIASGPKVLLLDESTASLDLASKTRVESTVEETAAQSGISVLWITHDEDQVERMGS